MNKRHMILLLAIASLHTRCGETTSAANRSAHSPAPDATATYPHRIASVQGRGHSSPLLAQTVSHLSGVVTAVRTHGFYIQDPAPDACDATSEGLFIFTGSPPTVAIGDLLQVSGEVSEYRPACAPCTPSSRAYDNLTVTQLSKPPSIIVLASAQALPAATTLGHSGARRPPTERIATEEGTNLELSITAFDPAASGLDFYESLEGMRVSIHDALVVAPAPARARELVVVASRGEGATSQSARGGMVLAKTDANPERIFLSNSLGASFPKVEVGDVFLGDITGIVDYSYGNFKVLVSEPLPQLWRRNLDREISALTSTTAAELTIATMNTENLDPSDGPAKFAALATVIVSHLGAPDLVALQEVQDDSGPKNDGIVEAGATLHLLTEAITVAGGPAYDYRQVDPEDNRDGGEPSGNIRVALLLRRDRGLVPKDRGAATFATPSEVSVINDMPALDPSPGRIDPDNPAFIKSRKPLAVELEFYGRALFVIVAHFNSKSGDGPLFGRFQPPASSSRERRVAQATVVADFVARILAIDPQALVVVAGDLNDFEFAEPVQILASVGLTPLIETLPQKERYTYIYEGNGQALDHIIVSSALACGAAYDVVHVNAELAERASDHDPSLARLCVDAPASSCPADLR